MKSIRTAIAGILTLFVASAAIAQTFPTVPSRSVIGRLGTAGQSGPSQAIPFDTLATQLGVNNYWPVFNVGNYATPALAIAAARAAGNGNTVYFPCGSYSLGSAARGLDLRGASALRLTGAGGVNGGAGQCVTLTYTGTGTMMDADLAYGLEIDHLYLLATGAGAKIINGDNTFALSLHDNFMTNTSTNASNIGVTLAISQGAVIERNGIAIAGGIGIRGVAPAGSFSVNNTIAKNTFFASNDIAISSPGQAWTIAGNISQNPVTGFIRPGPASSCDNLMVFSNDIDDVTAGKTLVHSNCKSITSISNRYTGAGPGNAGILQDNSTGTVTSINDRFDGALGINIGTGNYLFVTRGSQTIAPTALWSGTPANTDVVQTTGGAADITGKLSLGLSGSYAGSLRFWNGTAGSNSVTVAPPTGATGLISLAWPGTSGTVPSNVTAPITLGASTGTLACATCVTSSGGGAVTGTAPISVSAAAVVSLDAAGVTYAKIQNLGALAVMGRSANSSGVGADIQATAASDAVLRESGSVIGFGTIATGGIANNAVTLAKLATQATNTVLANATSGTAVPTALAVSSCSTSSSALIWTTNTGFGCNTSINAATLGGATFAAPGAIGGGTAAAGTFTALNASTSVDSPTIRASSTLSVGGGGVGAALGTLVLNGGTAAGGGADLEYRKNSVTQWYQGHRSAVFGSTSDNFILYSVSGGIGVTMEVVYSTGITSFPITTAATSSTTGGTTFGGGVGVAGAVWAGTYVATGAVAVGSLPACGAGLKSARHFVTDANATFTAGIGAVVAAGGANNVPVTCDGTNWRIGANDNLPTGSLRKYA